MQEFITRNNRHEFKVDGRKCWLPGATVADYEAIAAFAEIPTEEQVPAFRDFVLSRVEPRGLWADLTGRSGAAVAKKLSMPQLRDLFAEWIAPGASLGESSGSESQ